MTETACPPDCKQDRERHTRDIESLFDRSLPSWARAILFSAVVALFGLYGALWVFSVASYETKADAQIKASENKDEFRRINDKLDRLLQRGTP
jgi:hypothetical protein